MSKINETDYDDVPINRGPVKAAFNEILKRRISRRQFIATSSALFVTYGTTNISNSELLTSALSFSELSHGLDETLHVAEGYEYQVVVKWGDPIFEHAPPFNAHKQSSNAQLKQFGYNNDFVAYLPISHSQSSENGLLIVNHEFVKSRLMHPGSPDAINLSKEQTDTEIAAHGLSILEITKANKEWKLQKNSKYNRRITPHTKMKFSGPATGNQRLRTEYAPLGNSCIGTLANCAGCITPWGTVLTAEENIQTYFIGQAQKTEEFNSYKRFGLLGDKTARSFWGKYHERWNLNKHPNAGLHAGWIVEFNPLDQNFVPVKRTALGRFKHEGCDVHINIDGRAVVYMGDDQAFEYVYRFISKEKYQAGNFKHNMALLDEGELSVAEFLDNGSVFWHPLIWGRGQLTKQNGFNSQADIVIDTRRAADLVGATPMDRPEEIKVAPHTGNVYANFTNNIRRAPLALDAANPRAFNRHGHILELIAPSGDHAAREYKWEIFLLAGNPNVKFDKAYYHSKISENGWFSSPDNCTFDVSGNLWIASDGFYRYGTADGIWVCATTGNNKALTKHFLRAPREAEVCSPCFTPDHKTMFCSIQHPGGDSSFDRPSTRWPDFNDSLPPRPSVIAITHKQGAVIGS